MLVSRPNLGFGRGRPVFVSPLGITDDYERSSVILSLSSVVGDGDDGIVVGVPMPTIMQTGAGWIEPSFMVTGALGKRPKIRIPYADEAGPTAWTGYSPNRKGMWSPDLGVTWIYFDTTTINTGGGYIEMRHNTAFTADTVIIGRSRQVSLSTMGGWLDVLLSAYPSIIGPAASALAYSPGSNLASYGAQSCIAAEFSQQTQLYWQGTTGNTFSGRTVPPTPKWCLEINDTSLMPPGDAPKDVGVIVAGTHAGEDLGDYAMMRMVEHLLGGSAESQNMRRYFRMLLYPCMNPPGRAGGHFRAQYQRSSTIWPYVIDDLNRNFNLANAGFETNDVGRAVLVPDLDGEIPKFVMDFHGTFLTNGFAIIKDEGVTLHETFRSRLQTACGFTIYDDANTPTGAVTAYFRDLGTPLYIIHELGDQTPKADALYVTHGAANVQVLSGMKDEDLI